MGQCVCPDVISGFCISKVNLQRLTQNLKNQISSITWGFSAWKFATVQVWLLLGGDCGGTLWKTAHKPNVFYMYFNIFKQKQAAFYASKCANICKKLK